jgi:hypothetical protein
MTESSDGAGQRQALERAFLEDHRRLTGGLSQLLQDGALRQAVELADKLDREVGAHIAFEQHVYYPALRQHLGDEFIDQLLREHEVGQSALKSLLAHGGDLPLEPAERERLKGQIEVALDHARSCGTLWSHLRALDDPQLAQMHAHLRRHRSRGRRWSEL